MAYLIFDSVIVGGVIGLPLSGPWCHNTGHEWGGEVADGGAAMMELPEAVNMTRKIRLSGESASLE